MVEAPKPVVKSPEQYFIDFFLKEKQGKLTVGDVFGYNDVEKLETWLGPDMDALGLLEKYCWLGLARYDEKTATFFAVKIPPKKEVRVQQSV